MQVQLLMASQFLPSIYTCSFEWQIVPTHPPQNNIYLISIAPGLSTFSSAEPLLGKQGLASRKGREKNGYCNRGYKLPSGQFSWCTWKERIFSSHFFLDPAILSAENGALLSPNQVSICPVVGFLLSTLLQKRELLTDPFTSWKAELKGWGGRILWSVTPQLRFSALVVSDAQSASGESTGILHANPNEKSALHPWCALCIAAKIHISEQDKS